MDARDFTYWLQGYFEVSGSEELDKIQTAIVKDHLNLVFEDNAELAEMDPSEAVGITVGDLDLGLASADGKLFCASLKGHEGKTVIKSC